MVTLPTLILENLLPPHNIQAQCNGLKLFMFHSNKFLMDTTCIEPTHLPTSDTTKLMDIPCLRTTEGTDTVCLEELNNTTMARFRSSLTTSNRSCTEHQVSQLTHHTTCRNRTTQALQL